MELLTRRAAPSPAPPRRFIPALPTLGPALLWPLRPARAPVFPFTAPRCVPFYLARNAVFHAVRLLGLAGREVLVPAYHHGVEVAALVAGGASPRFVRVDGAMRLDLDHLADQATPRTAAVYVIHYAGFPQPMGEILDVARRLRVPVIEDCALSLYASERGRPVGSTGDVAVFCFYKSVPVPNGGALLVNDPDLRGPLPRPVAPPAGSVLSHASGSLLAHLAFRGGEPGERIRAAARRCVRRVRETTGLRPISTGTTRFDPGAVHLGMSAISEWILRRLDAGAVVAARRRNFALLAEGLRGAAAPIFPVLPAGACPLFYPLVCDDKLRVQARLAAAGIETVNFWRTGHPSCPAAEFPEVAALRERVLELPIHQDLEPEDVEVLARAVREALA